MNYEPIHQRQGYRWDNCNRNRRGYGSGSLCGVLMMADHNTGDICEGVFFEGICDGNCRDCSRICALHNDRSA